jgi:predicted ribosomally synthesized peptide with nif11-like leader
MSREALEQFRSQVLENPALQEKLLSVSDRESFCLRMIQLGAELGFNFTTEDVEAALRDGQRSWVERWIRR